jgi:hypothetical protein
VHILLFIFLLTCSTALLAQDGGLDSGFGDDDDWGDSWEDEAKGGWAPVTGFAEAAAGTRWEEDAAVGRYATLLDLRWRLETGYENSQFSAVYKGDFLYDGIEEEFELDVRDLWIAFSPLDKLDMKIGRQVLTWGTGDLLFLNDLFPKDWQSFFAGRDDEYLKAPSNSWRTTQYNKFMNIDFVWTPKFTPDIFIDGDRFSYYSPFAGEIIGNEPPLQVDDPSNTFENGEFALRLFKTFKGVEYALYGYYGFFKTPSEVTGPFMVTFAPMTSAGGSLRRPLGPGLFNAELSYYYSRDDSDGTNPLIQNSQARFLLGYEWEAARNFNVGLQYYIEHIADYDNLIENSPSPAIEPAENRHLITTRLTYRAMQEKLTWSFFAFWSPSDNDAYLRPIVTYRASDQWTTTFGFNLFGGQDQYTFLGQFEDNSNVYLRLRYNY